LRHLDVLIRADASRDIGTGHVLRCIVIAEWLQRAGASVAFAMRCLDGNLIDRVKERGFEVIVLRDGSEPPLATWLTVEPEEEIAGMQRLVEDLGRPPRWIIVDHYELDAEWERAMAALGSRLCAVDDIANRPHDSDVLLDATLTDPGRYEDLVPHRTLRLLGLRYAPIRNDFVAERERARTRDGHVRRILVFYGGVDWTGETLKALRVLRSLPRDVTIDVVTGPLNLRLDEIRSAIAEDPRARLRAGETEMAELTGAADFALGAIGTAMWERCFVGCPAVVTATLRLTVALGPGFGATGAAVWMGYAANVSEEALRNTVAGLLDDPGRVREMSRAARSLADGYVEARAEFVGLLLS
jgi:UDP-2,4-diacetamido-2,4,6-trideoxy-beta-L-altropyranose hydrolase